MERDDPAPTIHSYGDGLWWAMSTFGTVGYGDTYPVTASGRDIVIALMLGITAFGVVTAKLAALFVEEQEDHTKLHLEQMAERMRGIERALLRTPSDHTQLPPLRRRIRKSANATTTARTRKRNKRRLKRHIEETAAGQGTGSPHACRANVQFLDGQQKLKQMAIYLQLSQRFASFL